MEFEYMTTFKNRNRFCSICGKSFFMKEYQGNTQMQLQFKKLEDGLASYKENKIKLQRDKT